MESYNVVFSGVIADGFALDAVVISLRESFGISGDAKIKQLFSGNRVVLKKDLDRRAAWQFKEKLGDMGIVAELEKIESDPETGWLSFEDDASAENVSSAKSPVVESATPSVPTSSSDLSLEPIKLADDHQAKGQQASESPTFQVGESRLETTQSISGADSAGLSAVSRLSSSAGVAAATVVLEDNSSGGGGAVSAPPQASGLCWGGFFLGWIWAVSHRTWFGLLGLIPVLSLPVALVLLFKGRDWAWRNKRWKSVEHFNEVQRKWSIAGSVIALLGGIFWFQFLQDVSEFTEAEALQMEEQRQQLQDRLETIEDPEQRKQLEAIINLQQELQTELEKQQ